MATIEPPPGVSAGGSGWIRLQDADGQGAGVVSNLGYSDGPTNTELDTFDSSTLDLVLTVRSSFANILVNATPFTLSVAADSGHYEGDVNFSVGASGPVTLTVVTPDGATGAMDIFNVTVDTPPELLTLSFTGGYQGAQTELKAGDPFQITGTTDKPCTGVEIQNLEACVFSDIAFGSTTSFTVTGTIADRGTTSVSREAFVRAKNVAGALGTQRGTNVSAGGVDGTDVVVLNDLYPTIDGVTKGGATGHAFGISFPGIQEALKNTEQASVTVPVSNFDTILYDDPTTSEIDVAAVTANNVFTNPKVVERSGGGYNVSIDNFRIAATRAANDATTVVSGVVSIANVVPTIDITVPATRLRSGGNNGTAAQDHTVTITANQDLLNAPTLDADSGGNRGAFQGVFVGGPTVWTRDLRVDETVPDEKGAFVFEALVATGLSGLVQNTINSGAVYTLGGFVSRTLTFAAFATTSALGTSVETFANLTAGTFTSTAGAALKQNIGTGPSVTNGYTIDATGVNPTDLIWLDTPAAGANSGGTATITGVEETP